MVASQGIRESAIDTLTPAALDRDGRLIAFVGRNASGSPHGCCQNVYILDRSTGAISQESVGPDGAQPDGDSNARSLSSDGKILAFETLASTFTGRRRGRQSVVVRNRRDRVWHTPANVERSGPNGETREPAISGNGAFVVFTSDATDLTHGPDLNGTRLDVYRWRLDDSTIVRVSVDSRGVQSPAGASHGPSVNDDGALIRPGLRRRIPTTLPTFACVTCGAASRRS